MKTNQIHWSITDLKKRFMTDLPHICQAALEAEEVTTFKTKIRESCRNDTITRLCKYDGQTIRDFSTEKEVLINTISVLFTFLRGKTAEPSQGNVDLLTDLYFIFLGTVTVYDEKPVSINKTSKWIKRWSSGLASDVLREREESKQRIIKKLISRIESRRPVNQQFCFPESIDFDEKNRLVNEWWNNYRFHLQLAIKSPDELNSFLDNTLSSDTMRLLYEAQKKGIPFFVTPYYVSLVDITGAAFDDAALRSYMLYTKELVDTFGQIEAWEKEDRIEPGKGNAAGWILPEGKNIHRRYPDVAILIPDTRGRACGGLCASCQRMYDFQSKHFNFDLIKLLPKESWPQKLKKLMAYFEEDTQIRDVLITGGDAFMSRNSSLRTILEAFYRMALKKKNANIDRPDGEKYAEIQRIRLGTRLLAYLPMRVDDELIAILKDFRERAQQNGIKQFIIQTHFQSPLEMTREAQQAIRRITSAGWIVTNQLVFNVAASRRGHTNMLRKTLINNGVVPYYTFVVKGFHENYAVYAPIARLMQEKHEEKVYGLLHPDQQDSFIKIVSNEVPYIKKTTDFLRDNDRIFVATDRSMLNLPGIGKSMTFQLVGITSQGKRILRFDHDVTRKHSQAIEKIGAVYITENKSILAYLRQLEQLGEDMSEYQTIWGYTEDVSEPKFKLYEYPDFQFRQTEEVNHFQGK